MVPSRRAVAKVYSGVEWRHWNDKHVAPLHGGFATSVALEALRKCDQGTGRSPRALRTDARPYAPYSPRLRAISAVGAALFMV